MSRADITVIIVNWRVRALLEKCLNSIIANSDGFNVRIIVVDNDSRDGTSEMLMMEYPQVRVIALPSNIGFAAGNNLAIKQAEADYVFFLNPDTEILPGFFANIMEYMQEHPEVGIVGPKILNLDKSLQLSVRRSPDLVSQTLTLLKLQNILGTNKPLEHYVAKIFIPLILKFRKFFSGGKILPYYLAGDFDYDKEQSVEQIMGAAMVIRSDVLDKIGVFDEKFFIWFEEVDLCLRARQAGVVIKYFPGAAILHQGGCSFSKRNVIRKQVIFNKSLLYYFWKHKPKWQWLIILLLLPINLILTLVYVTIFKNKQKQHLF
ncbi:glycosyltransferase family 2 protein [bacterium]|nr:glycosyltransferase family 2 protein [bacterium]